MVLNPITSYPQNRAFVLQLHRDAHAGHVFGRVVHMTSGDSLDFADADSLARWLAAALASHSSQPTHDGANP